MKVNKIIMPRKGFAIVLALMAIIFLTLVIFAYNSLVRGKALETRHLAYNMKALKCGQALSRFATNKLRELVETNPDDPTRAWLMNDVSQGSNSSRKIDSSEELYTQCKEYLEKLTEDDSSDPDTIIIARVNDSDLEITVTPVEVISIGGSSSEKLGKLTVSVKVFIGNSDFKIHVSSEEISTTVPFKVVSVYPDKTNNLFQYSLYVKDVYSNTLTAGSNAWQKPPTLILENNGANIYLGLGSEVISGSAETTDYSYGFAQQRSRDGTYLSVIMPIESGDPNAYNTELGFRTTKWSLHEAYRNVNNQSQGSGWKKILGDDNINTINSIVNKGPLWIVLFGKNNEHQAKIFTKSGADIKDNTVQIGYLINAGDNNKLLAALTYQDINDFNNDDSKLTTNAEGSDAPYLYPNGNILTKLINDNPPVTNQITDLYKANFNKVTSRIVYNSYIAASGGGTKPECDSYFGDKFDMEKRVVYKDLTVAEANDFLPNHDHNTVIRTTDGFPPDFTGTVISHGSINGIGSSEGKYVAISEGDSSIGNANAFIYVAGTAEIQGDILGNVSCKNIRNSGSGEATLSYERFNEGELLCVAIGPEGAEP